MMNDEARPACNQSEAEAPTRQLFRAARLPKLMAIVLAFTSNASTAFAEDFVAKIPDRYEVTVHQVLLQGVSTLQNLRGLVSVEATFKNLSDAPLTLERSQIKASCADRTFSVTGGRQSPMLSREPVTLKPQETITGWLRFSVYHSTPSQPMLNLKFDIEDQVLDVSINDAIRKTSTCTWRTIGPNDMLAVVSLKRPVDGFAVWVLTDTFTKLKKAGIKRVVVEFLSIEDTWAVSSNSMSVNSVDGWLLSATKSQQPTIRIFANEVKSPIQFEMLYVVQPSTYRKPAYGYAGLRKPDLKSAIAASLRDVFQVLPANELETAFSNPEPGIRQAALETNLDRLPDERLQQIFDAATDDVDQQILLASELHRSASKLSLQFLEDLARSENPDVSQAALRSIIKSASEQAVLAALKLWRELEGDPVWETDFANAILKEDDYRFTVVLATYAEKRLISLTSDSPAEKATTAAASKNSEQTPPAKDAITKLAQRRAIQNGGSLASERQMNTLPRVLRFLQKQNDREFQDVAIQQLLKIRDPTIQDDVLQFVLETDSAQAQRLVQDYINLRLPEPAPVRADEQLNGEKDDGEKRKYAPRVSTASRGYSSRLFDTIKRFPRPEYTERLLELSEDVTLPSSSRTSAFEAAFQAATEQQIDFMIDDFDSFSRLRRSQALKALRQLQHPRWLELAEASLKISPESSLDTLKLLEKDGSLEAILLMVKFLDEARKTAEEKSLTQPLGVDQSSRQVISITRSLYLVNHPEAQAYLNRLEKSPLLQFHQIAQEAKARRYRASGNGQLKLQAVQYRIDGDNEKAEEIFRQVLDSDPYDDAAMSSLASLCMRSNRPEEAMQLLLNARKVSPEDVETESFIGLAMIRLGDVEGGLKLTEETLAEVPDLQTNLRMNALYNTACAYSRASEKTTDQRQKDKHIASAFRYLNLSIDREKGFSEVEHALADPDLNPLHQLPEWDIAINKMKAKLKPAKAG